MIAFIVFFEVSDANIPPLDGCFWNKDSKRASCSLLHFLLLCDIASEIVTKEFLFFFMIKR